MSDSFAEEYKKLNKAQKEAVDTIDGPVMVVAGPGTGKTQVLALRIANILKKTDTDTDSILCLTFTRAGVKAMRERLLRYIKEDSRKVAIQTFHSFAISLVEKHYELLDFDKVPDILKDDDSVLLIDEILHSSDWEHIHARGDSTRYFSDLKSLVSLMKREGISEIDLLANIESEIKNLEDDPENISSRGETKGKLKKEIEKKIESLSRTKEVARFFGKYEEIKRKRSLMDYDDVLKYAVELVEENESVRADLRENYLYIHIDEHQDSSGIQNRFLKAVWQEVEKPNIFVVGDDRQLIYGFGGASLDYFKEFKTAFGQAHLITLIENYRSTGPILSLADTLLESSITKEKLNSNRKETNKVVLSEYFYPRDEIIGAGLHFRKLIEKGFAPSECALLVPKNRLVNLAVSTLRNMGLPVKSVIGTSFFDAKETQSLRNILGAIANPYNNILLAETILDPISKIPPIVAHGFLYKNNNKNLSIETLLENDKKGNLFDGTNPISLWGKKLSSFIEYSHTHSILETVHEVANNVLIEESLSHEELISRVEIVRTFIHLVSERLEKSPKEKLSDFLEYLDRLEGYNHNLTTATLSGDKGISVMTLHASKGLEYESVWIAHANESTLMASKRLNFTLPEKMADMIEKKDNEVAKRELYVAITRAKEFCTISYATNSNTGKSLELAEILADIPEDNFDKKTNEENQSEILSIDPKIYVEKKDTPKADELEKLKEDVKNIYTNSKVSVTLLNNFFECPWKWYFRNLLQLPELKNESLQFGSAVHSTIERILKLDKKPTEKFIKDTLLEEFQKEKIVDENAISRLLRDGMLAVENWVEKYYANLAKDYDTERPLSFYDSRFPELLLYGKIDLTERFPDGTMTVTDFKTGSSKTKGVIEKLDDEGRLSKYMRQLAMYDFLITGTEKGKKVDSCKLLFLEADKNDKNAVYGAKISDEQIDLLVRDIEDYDKLLKTGEWIDRQCQFKPFGSGSEKCENCELARKVYKIK